MGKGKQVAAGTTQRTTNLPEYADPYFRRLLQGAEEASMPFDPVTGQSTYMPYQGERLAPSSMYGDIQGSRAMTRGIAQSGIAGMGEAMGAQRAGMAAQQEGIGAQREGMDVTRRGIGYTEEGIGNLRDIGQYDTGRFDPYSQFRMANYNQFGFQQPERFGGMAAAQYMSPYMDAVVDEQKRGAMQDFRRQQAGRDAAAVQAGAFGGSRQAVGDYLSEEGLMDTLGGIEATGRQQAFQQAAQQFGADREARMQAERQQAAELSRVQAGRAGEMGRVQGAEASELGRIQSALEQSRQFGAGQALAAEQAAMRGAGQLNTFAQGLGGLGMNVGRLGMNVGSLGQSLAGLGERQRAADIQGAQLLETVGRDIRAEDQGRLDLAYEDFTRQRDYPMKQYERFANLLRGIPTQMGYEDTRLQQYNPIRQALGAGISALGLYRGLTG